MTLELSTALDWTQRLLALGLAVQAAEGWVTRRSYGPDGPWATQLAGWRGGGLGAGGTGAVFLIRLAGAVWLLSPWAQPVAAGTAGLHVLLLVTSLWLTVRTRGPLCGGSDSMFFQVQLGLTLAAWGGGQPGWTRAGLAWIAAHSVLSYFLAGWVKARRPRWWNGEALQNLFRTERPYAVWSPARRLATQRGLCCVLGLAVVLVEVLFPLILVLPVEGRLIVLAAGLAFHLGIAATLGLNRFVWAWVATYPALLAL